MADSTSEARIAAGETVRAASVAVFRDGLVLLARRARPPAAGLWSLPGGRVEPGETPREAALRELGEEVGVSAEIIGPAGEVEFTVDDGEGQPGRRFVIHAFAASWRAGEPRTGPEAEAVMFADPASVGALLTTPGLQGVLAQALAVWEARR